MMSAGVPSSCISGLAPTKAISPTATPKKMVSSNAFADARRTRLASPAPISWETTIEIPPVIPVDRKRKHPVVELVAPMEASAPAPTKRPSTIVSTMLYISWKIPPIIIGIAN